MKKLNSAIPKAFVFALLIPVFFSSCAVVKRHYNKGYYIGWNSSVKKTKAQPEKKETLTVNSFLADKALVTEVNKNELTASVNNLPQIITKNKYAEKHFFTTSLVVKDSCDIIMFKNYKQVYVKVTETGKGFVKYKLCGAKTDSVIKVNSSTILMMKYANSTLQNMDEISAPTAQPKGPITHPWANGSFWCALSAYILMPLIMAYGAIALLGGILLVFGLALGICALKKIKKEPEKYKGRWKAETGIILGLLPFALFIGLIIYIFLFFRGI